MDKVELFKKLFEEGRISLEELSQVCSEEELLSIIPKEELVVERNEALTEILNLIQIREAHINNPSPKIGFQSSNKEDQISSYINKTILKLLKENYG